MAHDELELDTDVRDWVFIPLTMSIVLMKLLTQFAHMLMYSPPGSGNSNKEPHEIKEQQAVARSQRMRAAMRFVPEQAYKMRREYFVGKDTGLFHQKVQSRSMQEAMATDPTMMVDMMKKNLTGIVPQLAMGMVVNFFFSGFVLGKIPFALSPRFKLMLQRGIDLASLNVSYFTSLSYYILLLFGLRGVFSLVFREETIDETELMKRQMNPMAGASPMGFDADSAFKGERAALAALDHEWDLDSAEERAVALLRKTNKQR
mmetsp:Transcript_12307/g.30093  ORF Transcript_12307/g.30093 Transcript_12307/m.30093 type:complete len:260 (-) Transcript_12307:434-1213(-)|eukprot:CAMPEP_0202868796 /NCGR_PEP_ID=MMETSP1391-20130828/11076_1 /ASSEMBLY_ACC=CAM_ASM_000867 /TAXON_ID=1034604 /ORGANISM="Chlamydomonas leiostraca, Strain SAG 11-49" /LENGTH=259 /DNA_ID=CAMNT_0049549005 /DNA_START=36 /DNA_END=815 /DNA_ORIENTATION=+